MPGTKPINEAQVAQPGLAVVEVAACDDQTAFATQELLAGRSRPVRDTEVSINTGGRVEPGQACLRLSSRCDGVPGGLAGVVAAPPENKSLELVRAPLTSAINLR